MSVSAGAMHRSRLATQADPVSEFGDLSSVVCREAIAEPPAGLAQPTTRRNATNDRAVLGLRIRPKGSVQLPLKHDCDREFA
jgi:hypothetical protein